MASQTPESYIGILAALYAGAAAVPLSSVFPAERTAAMVTAASVGAFVVDAKGGEILNRMGLAGTRPMLLPDTDAVGPAAHYHS